MNTNSLPTSEAWLKTAVLRLQTAGVPTARLDALILLEDATGHDRGWLLAHPEFTLQGSNLHNLEEWMERRIKHEPLAYIKGKSEFYGREFIVSAATLQPRPETETMIDQLKELIPNSQKLSLLEDSPLTDSPLTESKNVKMGIIDVGTGSGCLGITAKLEFPHAEVIGTDISSKCIKIAKQNAKKLGAQVEFYQANLLAPIPPSTFHLPASILLANLPYVPNNHTINEAAMFEPKLAIFGGHDGLDLYRRMFIQVANLSQKVKFVLTEALPFQHTELEVIAKLAGYRIYQTEDFIQVFVCYQS